MGRIQAHKGFRGRCVGGGFLNNPSWDVAVNSDNEYALAGGQYSGRENNFVHNMGIADIINGDWIIVLLGKTTEPAPGNTGNTFDNFVNCVVEAAPFGSGTFADTRTRWSFNILRATGTIPHGAPAVGTRMFKVHSNDGVEDATVIIVLRLRDSGDVVGWFASAGGPITDETMDSTDRVNVEPTWLPVGVDSVMACAFIESDETNDTQLDWDPGVTNFLGREFSYGGRTAGPPAQGYAGVLAVVWTDTDGLESLGRFNFPGSISKGAFITFGKRAP